MKIADNILRHYLRNCYFINGTAYAGKSTMCRMLSERFDMLHCEENYTLGMVREISDEKLQPNCSYMNLMPSWEHFVLRSPDEYESWVDGNGEELAEFEIAELLRRGSDRKMIVDTCIPCEILHRIAQPDHVAIMLSPPEMAVERFFDRSDPEKQFLLRVIDGCPDPKAALQNFRNCIARVNSPQRYEAFKNSGFFVIERQDDGRDTREETLEKLAKHFGLMK